MPTSAHANFQANIAETAVHSVTMTLLIASVDYTSAVLKFPVISRDSRKVVAGDVKFSVPRNQTWIKTVQNSFAGFGKECEFTYGFQMAPGSADTIGMYKGTLSNVSAKGDETQISFTDKFYRLKDRKIGTSESPDYWTPAENPATLAWRLLVSYGDLDPTQSAANTDIDYNAWSSWHNVFDNDTIAIESYFDGQSVTEALQKISELTDSVIYQTGNGKIFCAKHVGINSVHGTITDSFIAGDVSVDVDKGDLVNYVTVLLDYNFVDKTWGDSITIQNTTSVTSWGRHEKIFDDTNVWYVSGVIATTHAEKIVYRRHEPNTTYKMDLIPKFILQDVGDIMAFTSTQAGVSSKFVVLQQTKHDTQRGKMSVVFDSGMGRSPAPFLSGFVLDDEVLGLLDHDYNPLIG